MGQNEKNLHTALEAHAKKHEISMHMPGHKENSRLFDLYGAEKIDITEIDGFDDLHAPGGLLQELAERFAALYGVKKTFLCVNGSSGGILAAVHAVCEPGSRILVARNCHRSVYNAAGLLRLHTDCFEPHFDQTAGVYTYCEASVIEKHLQRTPQTKAVVLTSPTYEGVCSDLESIRAVCRRYGAALITDAAHGAHLRFSDGYTYFGDIVITSLHKTLPAPTQTALVLCRNEKYQAALKKYMSIFQSSSPSYILLAGMSKCCSFLEQQQALFTQMNACLNELQQLPLKRLQLNAFEPGTALDRYKLNVSLRTAGRTPFALHRFLQEKNICCEMFTQDSLLLMPSVCTEKTQLQAVADALCAFDRTCRYEEPAPAEKPPMPEKVREMTDCAEPLPCPLEAAEGKICGETVCAYPPGSPILLPGERIGRAQICWIRNAQKKHIAIVGSGRKLTDDIMIDKSGQVE